ncbi:hypothetical protein ACQP1O_22155 [Nocardia sp. CA-151230]|uniref:hypothetical protein n=1 Tax=Nocardia sp. CA-151230 TaxID=3239982 RepID=UPI003D8E51EF
MLRQPCLVLSDLDFQIPCEPLHSSGDVFCGHAGRWAAEGALETVPRLGVLLEHACEAGEITIADVRYVGVVAVRYYPAPVAGS